MKILGNPIEKKLEEGPDVKAALLKFLRIIDTISSLGIYSCENDLDVQYALIINHAGQSILEGATSDRSIPLSVWPTVLERAFEKSVDLP